MQINDVAHTLHALRAGMALMGRTGVMGKRAGVSGPCENYKSTCELGQSLLEQEFRRCLVLCCSITRNY